jgi:hypothetical protein
LTSARAKICRQGVVESAGEVSYRKHFLAQINVGLKICLGQQKLWVKKVFGSTKNFYKKFKIELQTWDPFFATLLIFCIRV